MDFKRIRKKIDEGKYSTIDDMADDVFLLCENARVYFLHSKNSDAYDYSVTTWMDLRFTSTQFYWRTFGKN